MSNVPFLGPSKARHRDGSYGALLNVESGEARSSSADRQGEVADEIGSGNVERRKGLSSNLAKHQDLRATHPDGIAGESTFDGLSSVEHAASLGTGLSDGEEEDEPVDNSPISPVIALLLTHPLGLLWDKLLRRPGDSPEIFIDGTLQSRGAALEHPEPQFADLRRAEYTSGGSDLFRQSRWRRCRLWLAQGRWNEKEHSCVYISSNVAFGFAFATDVIAEQTKFYNQDPGIIYQILLTLSTQILGYTFAGLTRRYLVRPAGMIWPATLLSTAMFTTLHKEENKTANGWRVSRWRFFLFVWFGGFGFYFLPGLLVPALSFFNVITWFAPKNVIVANLFGVSSGLGLFPMTFDWSQIAYIGSPLLTPFWAAMNVVGGLVVVMWIFAPLMYYMNVFSSAYMPILSSAVFDNKGKPYDVDKILTPDFLFDEEAYQNYSRVFLPITYVLSYAVQFASLTALITHTICWHGKDIIGQSKQSLDGAQIGPNDGYQRVATDTLGEETAVPMSSLPKTETLLSTEDVHSRLMRRYQDAPLGWYFTTFVVTTVIGIFVVE
ncbi:MAG: hypothetical protein M1837_004679 [Sclerophora amabilis]|nr:MAG: hypothetical protein M1837_004679 [Sclerophora amabilis]